MVLTDDKDAKYYKYICPNRHTFARLSDRQQPAAMPCAQCDKVMVLVPDGKDLEKEGVMFWVFFSIGMVVHVILNHNVRVAVHTLFIWALLGLFGLLGWVHLWLVPLTNILWFATVEVLMFRAQRNSPLHEDEEK